MGACLRDRLANTRIRRTTAVQDAEKEIWVKKWSWAGQVARVDHLNRQG